MTRETLGVTWKIIRKASQGRNINTYCSYVAENENRKHKLRTIEGTKLFFLLENNVISSNHSVTKLYLDGIYRDDKLIYITNFRLK